jgi:hypothetical protein
MADMGPGLCREDKERGAALNHLNAPEQQSRDAYAPISQ